MFSLNTSAALPALAGIGFMADKTEIAKCSTLTQCLCADEISVWKTAVVDKISPAAHRSQFQKTARFQDLLIDAFIAFKVKLILRIILMPGIAPAGAGTFAETEGNDLFH